MPPIAVRIKIIVTDENAVLPHVSKLPYRVIGVVERMALPKHRLDEVLNAANAIALWIGHTIQARPTHLRRIGDNLTKAAELDRVADAPERAATGKTVLQIVGQCQTAGARQQPVVIIAVNHLIAAVD